MALVFMDSHQGIGPTPTLIFQKWTDYTTGTAPAVQCTQDVTRIRGQKTINFSATTASRGLYKTVAPSTASVVMGGWVNFGGSQPTGIIFGVGEGTTLHTELRANGAGRLTVTRNGTLLATGSTTTLATNTWYFLEYKTTISDTVGVVQVQVNGASESLTFVTGNATNQDTRNGGAGTVTSFSIYQQTSATAGYAGVFLLDSSGSNANDFIGPCQFVVRRPTTAGNSAQFTGNFGPNWANVADDIPDEDSSFNASTTAGHIDLFEGDDIPVSSGTVIGIQHNLRVKQDGGAGRTVRPKTRISSTNYNGTTVATSGSYATIIEPASVSPATSSAWTISEINGAEFGYELVS
jgi:hypothetical protein